MAQIQREEILEEWNDVMGVNDHYEFQLTETADGSNHITMGFNVYSLRTEGVEDVILSWHEEDLCFFIEKFLMEHQEMYLNYLAKQL